MAEVENQGAVVATDRSGHEAANPNPCDRFQPPDGSPPRSFQNGILTSLLGEGATTRTFAGDARIWTSNGALGDGAEVMSSYVVAAGLTDEWLGVTSGAAPGGPATVPNNGGSTQLIVENGRVMRTDDPTKQDWKNSDGQCYEGRAAAAVVLHEADLAKTCTLLSISATEKGTGRQLAQAPGQPNYLEVVDGVTVSFAAERKDTTVDGGADPQCEPGNHTLWKITWTGGGVSKDPVTLSHDTMYLDATDFVAPFPGLGLTPAFVDDAMAKLKAKGYTLSAGRVANTDAREKFYNAAVNQAMSAVQIDKSETHGLQYDSRKATAVQDEWNKDVSDRNAKKAARDAEWSKLAQALFKLWRYDHDPLFVNVSAEGCAGSQTASIKVFPSQEVEIDIFAAFGKKIEETLKFLEEVKKVSTFIGSVVSTVVAVYTELNYLQNPKCSVAFKYAEIDKEENGFHPYQVGRQYTLKLGFDPLLHLAFGVRCSLFQFFGFIGKVVEKVAGDEVKANARLEFALDLKLDVSITRDAVGNYQNPDALIQVCPHFTLAIEVNIHDVVKGWARASFGGIFTVGPFHKPTCDDGECLLEADLGGKTFLMIHGALELTLWGDTAKSSTWKAEIAWTPPETEFPFRPEDGKMEPYHFKWHWD